MKRNSEDIVNELKAISAVIAQINKQNVFDTPPEFFNEFPQKMIGFLKNNEVLITDISAHEEIEQLSPLLASLKEKPAFSVPEDYFGTISKGITEQIKATSVKTPVININTGKRKIWVRYAIAALITGIVATGSLLVFNEQQNKDISALESNGDSAAMSSILPEIPDQDLTYYLSSDPGNFEWAADDSDVEYGNIGLFAMDDGAIKNMFKEISYDVLKDYEEELSGTNPL